MSIAISTTGMFAKGHSWDITVSEAGKAKLTIHTRPEPSQRSFIVSKESLKELSDIVNQEDFFGLTQRSYGQLVPGGSTCSIAITRGSQTKKVDIHFLMNWVQSNPEKLKEPARALKVLRTVRAWFSDGEAVDKRKYDDIVIKAAAKG